MAPVRQTPTRWRNALKKFGLKVEEVSLVTRSMRVSGTAKAMEAAFKPEWAMMRSPTPGLCIAAGREKLQIPKELKGIVTGVFGLDQRQMAQPRSGAAVSAGHGALLKPLTPEIIEKLYKFPPGDGEGQTIAIAEFGGGYFEEDLTKYCNKVRHGPTPKVQTDPVGAWPAPVTRLKSILNIPNPEVRHFKLDESFEVMMDVEIIAGLCPKANISVYFCHIRPEWMGRSPRQGDHQQSRSRSHFRSVGGVLRMILVDG